MNRKMLYIMGLITIMAVNLGYSQINYSIKAEAGFSKYQYRVIQVDPGPNWQGYNLENSENGTDVNLTGGVLFGEKIFTGIGVGYLNFEGIDGLSVFTDIEYLPLSNKLTPLLNLKIGYSHIWNQYNNGTGTALAELLCGVNYRLKDKIGIYVKAGIGGMQQSFFIPMKIGLRF